MRSEKFCFLVVRSQQGPLQASIDERSEELTELVGMLARALQGNEMVNAYWRQFQSGTLRIS